jgi:hypothetical protein
MTYDIVRRQVVLFGGCCPNPNAETWTWNGTSWTLRSPATSPSPRFSHTMAFDAARRVTVLFGGTAGLFEAFDDTWVLGGGAWLEVG